MIFLSMLKYERAVELRKRECKIRERKFLGFGMKVGFKLRVRVLSSIPREHEKCIYSYTLIFSLI